jgi:hypothetical protein
MLYGNAIDFWSISEGTRSVAVSAVAASFVGSHARAPQVRTGSHKRMESKRQVLLQPRHTKLQCFPLFQSEPHPLSTFTQSHIKHPLSHGYGYNQNQNHNHSPKHHTTPQSPTANKPHKIDQKTPPRCHSTQTPQPASTLHPTLQPKRTGSTSIGAANSSSSKPINSASTTRTTGRKAAALSEHSWLKTG